MQKNLNKIKLFIKAKTEDQLVVLQWANNQRHDTMFEYDVMWNGKEYVAWFTADITKIRERSRGETV